MKYVLISAVRNEEKTIRYPIESVLSQTCLPLKWVIVSDGSTDETDNILRQFESKFNFIQFVRLEKNHKNEGFSSKVMALREAYTKLMSIEYSFIGVLDADISFNSIYYENIFKEFEKNDKLGISGGYIYEPDTNGVFISRSHNRVRSVAGAVQMFRRECYEMIGGLQPIIYGGEDTYAEILARANGWEVNSFPGYNVYHHKPGYLKRGVLKERFREGRLDYVLGTHVIYELLKFFRRIPENPFLFGAFIRVIGYIEALVASRHIIPPPDILKYYRKEQYNVICSIFNDYNKGNV